MVQEESERARAEAAQYRDDLGAVRSEHARALVLVRDLEARLEHSRSTVVRREGEVRRLEEELRESMELAEERERQLRAASAALVRLEREGGGNMVGEGSVASEENLAGEVNVAREENLVGEGSVSSADGGGGKGETHAHDVTPGGGPACAGRESEGSVAAPMSGGDGSGLGPSVYVRMGHRCSDGHEDSADEERSAVEDGDVRVDGHVSAGVGGGMSTVADGDTSNGVEGNTRLDGHVSAASTHPSGGDVDANAGADGDASPWAEEAKPSHAFHFAVGSSRQSSGGSWGDAVDDMDGELEVEAKAADGFGSPLKLARSVFAPIRATVMSSLAWPRPRREPGSNFHSCRNSESES